MVAGLRYRTFSEQLERSKVWEGRHAMLADPSFNAMISHLIQMMGTEVASRAFCLLECVIN